MRAPAALEHLLRHRVPPVDSFGRSQRGEAAEAALAAAEDVSPLAQPPHRAHLACCTLHTSALEHLLPPMQPAEPLGRAQRGEAAKATLPAAEAVPSLCDHHAASGAETPPPLNTGCPAKCSTLKPLTKRRGEAAGAALLTLYFVQLVWTPPTMRRVARCTRARRHLRTPDVTECSEEELPRPPSPPLKLNCTPTA